MTLADRVVVMKNGKIEQIGTPDEIYNKPATGFVAGFIGSPAMNFISCKLEKSSHGLLAKITKDIVLSIPKEKSKSLSKYANKKILLGIRPEHISENKQKGSLKVEAKLDIVEPLGMETMVYFSINNYQICGKVSPDSTLQNGKVITLYFDSLNFHFIDAHTDLVI